MEIQKITEVMSSAENMLIRARAAYTKIQKLQDEINSVIGEFNAINNAPDFKWNISLRDKAPNINDLVLTVGEDGKGQYDFNMFKYQGNIHSLLTKWIKLPNLED